MFDVLLKNYQWRAEVVKCEVKFLTECKEVVRVFKCDNK